MNIAQSKGNNPKSTASKKSKAEVKFDKAWQKVVRQQRNNTKLKEKLAVFRQEVEEAIREPEENLVKATQQLCYHLLRFYPRKTLANWQREELLFWLNESLEEIVSNPFADYREVEELRYCVITVLKEEHPGMLDEAIDGYAEPEYGPNNTAPEDEKGAFSGQDNAFDHAQEEASGQSGQFSSEDGDLDEDPFQGIFEEMEREQQAYEQRKQEDQLAFDRLFKSSAVNRLFRKLARILHPDLEQDERIKQQRNQQMSELTAARDNNDILAILKLYSDCTGQSPLDDLGEDLDSLTQLLNRQYQYLCDQHEDLIDEDPITAAFHQKFHRNTEKQRQKAIKKHIWKIEEVALERQRFCEEVTSLVKLKPHLEDRRIPNDWGDINEFLAMLER